MNRAASFLALFVLLTLGAACAAKREQSQPVKLVEETVECRNYRAMMTAPLPPHVSQRLKADCERSQARLQET